MINTVQCSFEVLREIPLRELVSEEPIYIAIGLVAGSVIVGLGASYLKATITKKRNIKPVVGALAVGSLCAFVYLKYIYDWDNYLSLSVLNENKVRLALFGGVDLNKHVASNGAFFSIWREDSLKLLIKFGGDINSRDKYGSTALHNLVSDTSDLIKDEIEFMLKLGADINSKDATGSTPLFAAIWRSNREKPFTVKKLIEEGADINVPDKLGDTPLHAAVRRGYKEIVNLLIEKGANINQGESTPLSEAVYYNKEEIFKTLIEKGADLNKGVYSPLERAVSEDRESFVKFLINSGADVNFGEKPSIFTALERSRRSIVEILIKAGAKLDRTHYGDSPLHYAARYNRSAKVIEMLFNAGADINAMGGNQETPLMTACSCRSYSIIPTLLKLGARVTDRDRLGQGALEHCVRGFANYLLGGASEERFSTLEKVSEKFLETSKLILERDVDINRNAKYYSTPLQYICSLAVDEDEKLVPSLTKLVKMLLEKGAELSTHLGKNQIEYLTEHNRSGKLDELIELLKAHFYS